MGDLKPISHKQFNEILKAKDLKEGIIIKLKESKAKFGFKPMYDRRTSVIPSEDMEPTEFHSMRKATKAMGVGEGSLGMPETMEETFLRTKTPRCFHKVVLTLLHIKCLTVHSERELTH